MVKRIALELIGKTPLVELSGLCKKLGLENSNIVGKLEYFNLTGSVKDRIAFYMIEAAEKSGKLVKGGTIIEATSGNTGIGIAAIGSLKGYKVILVMPETMSIERRNIISSYGAEIILSDGKLGMRGAIEKAVEISKEIKGSVILSQFDNKANPKAHFETTGPEIWESMEGEIDILIAGVGTGGTISGTGNYLKQMNSDIKIVAVEPKDSPVLSGGKPGSHIIQGIGAGFIPNTLDTKVYDEVIQVSNEDAINYAKLIAKSDAISVGISSGAAIAAAVEVARRKENEFKNIVVILPDSADRYYSTKLFQ